MLVIKLNYKNLVFFNRHKKIAISYFGMKPRRKRRKSVQFAKSKMFEMCNANCSQLLFIAIRQRSYARYVRLNSPTLWLANKKTDTKKKQQLLMKLPKICHLIASECLPFICHLSTKYKTNIITAIRSCLYPVSIYDFCIVSK